MIINDVRADKYYRKGINSIKEHSYNKAKKYLKIALFYNYSRSLIHYQMGLIHLYNLNLAEAIRCFIDYLSSVDKIENMVYFYMAYSYYLLDNKKEAKQWFQKAFKKANSKVVRYKVLFYLKKMDIYSQRQVKAILQEEDNAKQSKRTQALSFLLNGEYNKASKMLIDMIMDKGSVSSELYTEVSDCFIEGKNYNGFINFFYDVFKSKENIKDKTIFFNLAKSFYLANYCEEAKDILVILLRRFPYHCDLYFNLANVYYKLKRYNLSIKYYLKTVNIDSSFYKAYYNLGVLYQKEGLLKQSRIHYNKAININKALFTAHYNLGILYYQDREYIKALESIQSSLDIEPCGEEALHNFNVIKKLKRIINKEDRDARLLRLVNISLLVVTVIVIILFFYLR